MNLFRSRLRKTYLIAKSVVDLSSEPTFCQSLLGRDEKRLTQLLLGDPVELIARQGDWLEVKAPEQRCFKKGKWQGYPGWIHQSEVVEMPKIWPEATHVVTAPWLSLGDHRLSFATYLHTEEDQIILPSGERFALPSQGIRALDRGFSRSQLALDASLFIGTPYLWGGAAFFYPQVARSVDCSGLIYLLYRAQNRLIPRDAHDQWLQSRPISQDDLQAGDLLFMAKEANPDRISHVILYRGSKNMVEAPMTDQIVRLFDIESHLTHLGEGKIALKGRTGNYIAHFATIS